MHVIIATPTTNGITMAPFANTVIVATQAITERGGTAPTPIILWTGPIW